MSMAFPPTGLATGLAASNPAPLASPPLRLRLQINTSGGLATGACDHGWRTVIEFERGDEIACANVIAAAPLLAAAAGPGAALRICPADEQHTAYSHWAAGHGWRGALPK